MESSSIFGAEKMEPNDFENMLDTGRPDCYNNMRRGGQAVA